MKTTLFTAGQVMACLMLLGLSTGESADASTTVEAVFNLKAMYKNTTCDQTLKASGEISGTTIDFGTFSSYSVDITKTVALTLKCDSDLPDTVKVGFSVVNPATVDTTNNNWLYPSDPGKNSQTNLYYDWEWDEAINKTVKQSGTSGGHATLKPGDKVNLSSTSGTDVYEVVSQGDTVKVLSFPLKITRKVKENSQLAAGNYTADVKVTISYD